MCSQPSGERQCNRASSIILPWSHKAFVVLFERRVNLRRGHLEDAAIGCVQVGLDLCSGFADGLGNGSGQGSGLRLAYSHGLILSDPEK